MSNFFPQAGQTLEERREDEARSILSHYLRLPRDDELRAGLQRVLSNLGRTKGSDQQKTLLVVTGASGAGKSEALERLLANHPALPGFGDKDCALVHFELPSPATLSGMGHGILDAVGYPLNARRLEWQIWREVSKQLKLREVRMLWIDEFFHVTRNKTVEERKKIRDTIKMLVVRGMGLILSGLDEFLPLIESDSQLRRRAIFIGFKSIVPASDMAFVEGVIHGSCDAVHVRRMDSRCIVDACHRLIHATNEQVGTAICLVHAAVAICYAQSASRLDLGHFAEAYARDTGNATHLNPFLTDDWRAIDCTRVLDRQELVDEEVAVAHGRKNRGRRRTLLA